MNGEKQYTAWQYPYRGQEVTEGTRVSHPRFRRSGAPIILNHSSGRLGCDSSCDSTGLRHCSSSCQSSWARQLPSSDSPKISRLSSTSLLSLPSKCFAISTPGPLLKSLFLPKKAILYLPEEHLKPLCFLYYYYDLLLFSTYYLYFIFLWLLNIFLFFKKILFEKKTIYTMWMKTGITPLNISS